MFLKSTLVGLLFIFLATASTQAADTNELLPLHQQAQGIVYDNISGCAYIIFRVQIKLACPQQPAGAHADRNLIFFLFCGRKMIFVFVLRLFALCHTHHSFFFYCG
jgi:hypothetical protein